MYPGQSNEEYQRVLIMGEPKPRFPVARLKISARLAAVEPPEIPVKYTNFGNWMSITWSNLGQYNHL